MAQASEQAAVRAGCDRPFLERFIAAHEPFILRAAAKASGRAVTRSDDEYSVALWAFYEAVRGYNPASGPFSAYARLVIDRRLTDHFRAARRFAPEIALAPQTFDGGVDEESPDAPLQRAVTAQIAQAAPQSAADEIEAANAVFAAYGFSFYDLAACSPRAEKTRRSCAAAAAALLAQPVLLAELRRTHSLPVGALARASGVSKKLIERHRRYLIAAVLLLDGEYPILSEYLVSIRKEIAPCGR